MAWEPLPSERDTTHHLSEALERLHRTLGVARPDAVRIIESSWSSLVGRQLAAVCWLESLQGGRMVLGVSDPAVAEHLRWQSSDLSAAVNALCGAEVVSEVVTKVRHRR